ncbi:hypothetical protein NDU88_002605 [Pleurodeles waltl]|uniref:Uncharacterized protein n=1 Tax=Pleurodeles waltl TaxID=8319 RepID=A0AAV7MS65_PLEWA|nr:hypothetical protein NDU88_002605 [Pleurodeles waltl]
MLTSSVITGTTKKKSEEARQRRRWWSRRSTSRRIDAHRRWEDKEVRKKTGSDHEGTPRSQEPAAEKGQSGKASHVPGRTWLLQPVNSESECARAQDSMGVRSISESPRGTHKNLVLVGTTERADVIRNHWDNEEKARRGKTEKFILESAEKRRRRKTG